MRRNVQKRLKTLLTSAILPFQNKLLATTGGRLIPVKHRRTIDQRVGSEPARNLAARNRDAALSAAERTMYERARVNLISEIAPALKVSAEAAEEYLDEALSKGVLKAAKKAKKAAAKK